MKKPGALHHSWHQTCSRDALEHRATVAEILKGNT